MQPLQPTPTPRGCRPEDIPADIATWDGWAPRDCLNASPPPPLGWYSIPHWAALTEWRVFPEFDAPWRDILNDWFGPEFQGAALEKCAQEGFTPLEWPAPPRLASIGNPTVLLFPDPILRDVFNVR